MIRLKKKSSDNFPYIIAEISGNHNKSEKRSYKLIDEAKEVGVDAIKIQTFLPENITMDSKRKEFFINEKNSLWKGNYLYDLYKKSYPPKNLVKKIFNYAKKKNITCFSSVFDEDGLDFLESLNNPIYKVASFENNHFPLINKIIDTNKPIIVSTGMLDKKGIFELVNIFKKRKYTNFALLKCTSSYPANPKNSNIITIPEMKKVFKCEVGLSDHTLGIGVALGSIVLGSSIIEKHFTLTGDKVGIDKDFSLTKKDMKLLVDEGKRVYQSIGKVFFGISNEEKNSLKYKRSIYFKKSLKKNHVIKVEDIKIIRPSKGLHPRHLKKILNKKCKIDVKMGTPVSWNKII
tara:strand:- start:11641 stop:12681 length:1041 start_codon:yes stop_codon:yes gene_type:complete